MANELDIKTQEAISNIDNLTKSVLRLQDGLILVEKEAKDVNNSFNTGKLSDYNKAQKQSVEITDKLVDIRKLSVELGAKENLTLNKLTGAYVKLDKHQKNLSKQTATQTKRTLEANREFKKLEAELLRVTKAYQDMATKEGFASKNTQKLFRDVKRLRGEVDKIQQPIGNFNRKVSNYGTSLKNLANSGLAAAGIIGVVDTVIRIGESAFDTTRKLDSLNNAMLAVFETNEEVAKQNEFLTKIADNYGIEIITLTESYKGFSAAVKGTNLEGEKSQRIFDVITKTSAQLGLTTEQTEGALKALEQMISKGVVSAEELRGQLGERVPGAFRIFAEGLGVSTSKLGDMLKAGEIMADEALPKFADALEKAYSLDTVNRIDTIVSSQNRYKNSITDFIDNLEQSIGIIGGVSMMFNNMGSSIFNFLNELLPANNAITKSKDELNKLALQLKLNVDNEDEYNRILGEINDKYPSFLQGLTEEEIRRGDINKNLVEANLQYTKQLVLQEKQEELNGILEEQAQMYRDVSSIVNANSEALNGLNNEQTKVFNEFLNGKKSTEEARSELEKYGEVTSEQGIILSALGDYLDDNTGHLSKLDEEYKKVNTDIEIQNELLNKMVGLNGDVTSSQSFLNNSMDKFNDTIEFGNRLLASRIAISKGDFVGALVALAPPAEDTNTNSTTEPSSPINRTSTSTRRSTSNNYAEKAQKERLKLLKEERKELEKINAQLDENKDNYEVAVIKERVKDLREAQEAIEESLQKTSSDIGESSSIGMVDIEGDEQIKKMEQLMNIRDSISDGFSDLGLDSVANEFSNMFDTILDETTDFSQRFAAGMAVALTFASELVSQQADNRIESLDRENEAFQETQDKKIEAVERQLEAENLSAEEKEALNSQIEVFESQKEEKEKQTKTRQFKAQQKADAQQALINGALGATQTIARLGVPFGIAPAGISLAFGALQSALILSKSVPEFFMGTQNAPEGYAYTQERGAEMITDKKGNVKTYGNNKGSQLTYLEKGDKVYTSGQTKDILSDVNSDDGLFNSMILNKLTTPIINVDNGITESQMFSAIDRAMGKHSTPTYYNDNKTMFKVEAGKYPKAIGKVHHNKNNSYNRSKFN